MKRMKRELTSVQMIGLGFLFSILAGTLLLMLPVSQAEGQKVPAVDALFTAATSVCVTGLVTVTTAQAWSFFGKCVILFLIQLGGLGVVTFTTILLLVVGKRVTLKERLLLQDAYNLDTLNGLVPLTKRILKYTLILEGIGAAGYAVVFIPRHGLWLGITGAVFNSVSAFCNAGMDILGTDSLIPYRDHLPVNLITMALIIMGGLGFPVWWDLMGTAGRIRKENRERLYRRKLSRILPEFFGKLELHSRLVLVLTAAFIFSGMALTLLLEWNNPATIGKLSLPQKMLASLFQSVTTRTAGFLTIPQENFRDASAVVYLILMFIGGSPCGTAGGVKTVTVYMMARAALSTVRGRNQVEVFQRRIDESYIKKGMAVVLFSMIGLFLSVLSLSMAVDADFLDVLYECTSAIATVGLSRNLTGSLNLAGKLIIILTMYAGRIGPITLALFFNSDRRKKHQVSFPQGKIYIG